MVTQKKTRSKVKVYSLAVILSVVSAYGFGLLANSIGHNDLRCVAIGDIGGCDPNHPFLYIFGFYYALIFCITFSQIVFIRRSNPAYYIIMTPLLAFGLLEMEIFKIAALFMVFASLLGLIAAKLSKQPKQVGKT